MLIATFWIAMAVAMPGLLAAALTAVLVAIMAGMYLSYGSATIEVGDGKLRAGRAVIDVALVGETKTLDAEATRLRAGRDADLRGYLLLRPYAKRSVEVAINDPADSTPYWLINTRHPDVLKAAIDQARSTTVS